MTPSLNARIDAPSFFIRMTRHAVHHRVCSVPRSLSIGVLRWAQQLEISNRCMSHMGLPSNSVEKGLLWLRIWHVGDLTVASSLHIQCTGGRPHKNVVGIKELYGTEITLN